MRGRPDHTGSPARSFETPSIEPTLDGYVGFNTNTRQMFEDFLVLIDRPELIIEDESWAKVSTRVARWDEWNAIVHAWTTQHTTAEVVERAAAFRIPVAPVADGRAVPELDHVKERGIFSKDPTGSFRVPRRPWTIDGEPAPPPQPAPRLGEHTADLERMLTGGKRPKGPPPHRTRTRSPIFRSPAFASPTSPHGGPARRPPACSPLWGPMSSTSSRPPTPTASA